MICTWMFIADLFVTVKNWKLLKCSQMPTAVVCHAIEYSLKINRDKYWYMIQHGWISNKYAHWKNSDEIQYILNDFIYITFKKIQTNLWWLKTYCLLSWEESLEGRLTRALQYFWESCSKVYYFDCDKDIYTSQILSNCVF